MGVSTDWLAGCLNVPPTTQYSLTDCPVYLRVSVIIINNYLSMSSDRSIDWLDKWWGDARLLCEPPPGKVSSLWLGDASWERISVVSIQLIESQKQFDQPNEKCELCQECRSVSAIYRAIFEFINCDRFGALQCVVYRRVHEIQSLQLYELFIQSDSNRCNRIAHRWRLGQTDRAKQSILNNSGITSRIISVRRLSVPNIGHDFLLN